MIVTTEHPEHDSSIPVDVVCLSVRDHCLEGRRRGVAISSVILTQRLTQDDLAHRDTPLVDFRDGSTRENRATSCRTDKETLVSGITSRSLVIELHVIKVYLSVLFNSSVTSQRTSPARCISNLTEVRTLRGVRNDWLRSTNGGKSRSSCVVSSDNPIEGRLSGLSRSNKTSSKVLQIEVDTV